MRILTQHNSSSCTTPLCCKVNAGRHLVFESTSFDLLAWNFWTEPFVLGNLLHILLMLCSPKYDNALVNNEHSHFSSSVYSGEY